MPFCTCRCIRLSYVICLFGQLLPSIIACFKFSSVKVIWDVALPFKNNNYYVKNIKIINLICDALCMDNKTFGMRLHFSL